jgi:excisionase family DNA binding protein
MDSMLAKWKILPYFPYAETQKLRAHHPMEDDILTIREVAEFLKLTEKTVYRLVSEDKLPGFKVGGSWRFAREDLVKWIASQKAMAGEKR